MKRIIAFLLVMTLALGLMGAQAADIAALESAANAGDTQAMYELGAAYYLGDGVAQDYALAAYWWYKGAEAGDPGCQYEVGGLFNNGQGVEKNTTEAMKWIRKSSDAGFPLAMFYVGICYGRGTSGLEKNGDKARDTFYRAATLGTEPKRSLFYFDWDIPDAACFDSVLAQANGGNPAAMCDLAYMYYYGVGTDASNEFAAYWWYLAADAGVTCAMYNVAYMFINGLGTAQNTNEGKNWIKKFVAQINQGKAGEYSRNYAADVTAAPMAVPTAAPTAVPAAPAAQPSVSQSVSEGMDIQLSGIDIDAGQPEEMMRLVGLEGLLEAAALGDLDAAYILGWCYWYGVGVEQDYEEAFAWFYTLAEEEGDPRVYIYVGNACYLGQGTEQDYAEALKWYLLSAEEGDNIAMGNAADIYNYGRGNVPQDLPRAFALYKQSAELGNVSSMGNLGVCYLNGRGTSKNTEQAVYWITRAANEGNATAMYNLGQLYENGLGVDKSASTARSWYEKAAAAGNEKAKEKLGK